MKESYSDFSIIKSYIELRQKYDSEIRLFKDSVKESEDKARQQIATLEQEVAKRNEYIKAQERKLQEMTERVKAQEEQLRDLGLQLHKFKIQASQQASAASQQPEPEPEASKRRGFFK